MLQLYSLARLLNSWYHSKLLAYLVKNYRLTIKSLNLINNNIDESILRDIQHFVENEYDFENVRICHDEVEYLQEAKRPHQQQQAPKSSHTDDDNKVYDIKMRDQKIMDKYAKNGKFKDYYEKFILFRFFII